jgi:hypothetical protein
MSKTHLVPVIRDYYIHRLKHGWVLKEPMHKAIYEFRLFNARDLHSMGKLIGTEEQFKADSLRFANESCDLIKLALRMKQREWHRRKIKFDIDMVADKYADFTADCIISGMEQGTNSAFRKKFGLPSMDNFI